MEANKKGLKYLIKHKGVRHDYFSREIVQVTPSTLCRWISKTSRPPKLKVDIICEYFDVLEGELDIKSKKCETAD